MDYTEFMRVIENPYWCRGSPLKWQADGIGISHLAMEGKVGIFNLCWLMLQRATPPTVPVVYQQTNLAWVITLAGGTMVHGKSLQHHASLMQLADFKPMLRTFIERTHRNPVDFPGSVPWKTLYDLTNKKAEMS